MLLVSECPVPPGQHLHTFKGLGDPAAGSGPELLRFLISTGGFKCLHVAVCDWSPVPSLCGTRVLYQ